MKVSAINPAYAARVESKKKGAATEPLAEPKPSFTAINFKGGNPGDVLHVIAECKPFNQKGGVATVVEDYKKLHNISPTEKGKTVFVTPYYNGLVKYECNETASDLLKVSVELPRVPEGLPDGHPLKDKVGQPVYIKKDLSTTTVFDALKSGENYWLLEEVADRKFSWGMEKDTPAKALKVVSDAKGNPLKDNIYMIFSEATAYDPEPYSANQYSSAAKPISRSWGGDPYAKFDKAVVECMEDITKHAGNFDPGTVVCSDSQAAYVTHYMAQKNAQGSEYFKDKKPIQIGHNLGDGYVGRTSPRNMVVNLSIFTPEELEALSNSKELRDALVSGSGNEDEFFTKILANMKAKNKCSAISVPVHYGNTGYLQTFGVVSQGYLDEVVKNKEIAPYINEDLKDLKKAGVAIGLTNPYNGNDSAFTSVGLQAYKEPVKVKFPNGTEEVIQPMKFFKESDKATVTLDQVRNLKRENKINFLTRFSKKYDEAQYWNTSSNSWSKSGDGAKFIRRGNAGDISVVHNIDVDKYISKLKKGEDVKIAVSWGRGDFQKALDEVLNGFKKYVLNTGDKDTLLVIGGDLSNDKVEGQKVKDIAEILSKDEIFKGRVMVLDSFAPGGPMALMADTAILPSRTAPCELTDLEAKKLLCPPIVANGQGLAQKNFDPNIAGEAALADAFKTKHQYYDSMPREELLKDANEEAREAFNKVFNKEKEKISIKYKITQNKPISPETLERFLAVNTEYTDALRKLRDSVMADDIAACLKQCLIDHRNDDIAKTMLKNHANIQTGWENNKVITRGKENSGELYRQQFKKKPNNISKENVIGFDVDKSIIDHLDNAKGGDSGKVKEAENKLVRWLKEHKKTSIAGGAVVVAGLTYAGYKAGWFSSKNKTKNQKKDHISVVG